MPGYAWAYLLLLGGIGIGAFVADVRAARPVLRALLRLAAIAVLVLGVVLFHRGAGAGVLFMLALFLAVLVLAQLSVAEAQRMREQAIPARERVATALAGLATLPAIALGALAVWIQQGV